MAIHDFVEVDDPRAAEVDQRFHHRVQQGVVGVVDYHEELMVEALRAIEGVVEVGRHQDGLLFTENTPCSSSSIH